MSFSDPTPLNLMAAAVAFKSTYDAESPYQHHIEVLLQGAAIEITTLQARITKLEAAQQWQPMETMLNDVVVDVWVRSSANEFYGRRACDLHKRGDKWFGLNPPDANYAEYAYRWMPLPTQPAAQGEQQGGQGNE